MEGLPLLIQIHEADPTSQDGKLTAVTSFKNGRLRLPKLPDQPPIIADISLLARQVGKIQLLDELSSNDLADTEIDSPKLTVPR